MRQTLMANLTGLLLAGVALVAFPQGGPGSAASRSPVSAATAVSPPERAEPASGTLPPSLRAVIGGPALAPARSGTPRRPQVVRHTVGPGDTLWDLATAYGTDVTTLMAVNGLRDGHLLQVGQELRVLTIPGLIYTVREGDTLVAIAQKYAIAVSEIERANGLSAADILTAGRELILPGARPPFKWPLRGEITSAYGPRWGRTHEGLDIAGPYGAEVVATRAGRVGEAGWNEIYGYYVLIDHGDGVKTLYAHFSTLLVAAGDLVADGEPIGKVGSTGYSTGPHLHFEVREDGQARDPLEYLSRTQ